MTDMQFYALFAVSLAGLLCGTALFIHLGRRFDRMAERLEERITAIDQRLRVIETRLGIG